MMHILPHWHWNMVLLYILQIQISVNSSPFDGLIPWVLCKSVTKRED